MVEKAAHLAGIAIERKRAEELVEHLAFHDALTGLPNRRLLEDRLTSALALARRTQETLALMFLDLDRFKNVNDRLGHSGGDRLLQSVAERLLRVIRAGETVARVGGDEFMFLLPRVPGPDHAARAAERILAAVRQPPYSIDGQELCVTASIGVALSPVGGDDGETLMKNADAALYRAKELGRDNCQFHGARMAA
jgi:diguanylate cyclase (GGDEF)-like protein